MEISELIDSYDHGRRNFGWDNLRDTDMNRIDLNNAADFSGANLSESSFYGANSTSIVWA